MDEIQDAFEQVHDNMQVPDNSSDPIDGDEIDRAKATPLKYLTRTQGKK